jgi:hypothetical protein
MNANKAKRMKMEKDAGMDSGFARSMTIPAQNGRMSMDNGVNVKPLYAIILPLL